VRFNQADTRIVQAETQYEPVAEGDVTYRDFELEILPGVRESGNVWFPHVDPSLPMRVIFYAATETSLVDVPFQFEVDTEESARARATDERTTRKLRLRPNLLSSPSLSRLTAR